MFAVQAGKNTGNLSTSQYDRNSRWAFRANNFIHPEKFDAENFLVKKQ
jgi:hypothetical protein